LSPSLAAIVILLQTSNHYAVSNSWLAKTLLLHQSTMTRLVDQLVKKGFLERFEFDGIQMIALTNEAWEKFDLLNHCELELEAKYAQLLGEGNVHPLTSSMNQATDTLRSAAAAKDNCLNTDKNSDEENRPLPGKIINMPTIEAAYLQKAISYEAYTALFTELVANGQTTGPDQSEAFIHYTALNQQRMHRWEKTIQLLPNVEAAIRNINLPQTWLVLTEAWCGDAAHIIPVLHALAKLNPLITLRFLMRDENPELMDRYLTNGVSRSIPKLIAIDAATREELFTWGPRPAPLQAIFMEMKAEGLAYGTIKEELQRWYNKDRSVTIQEEMAALAAATSTDIGMTA
jgi:DNA-binding MarR family transcriptional regulator